MAFDIDTWKSKLREHLHDWRPRMQRAGVNSIYYGLSAAALWPLVQAGNQEGLLAAVMALGQVASGVGGNLIANQIQNWKDRSEAEIAGQLQAQGSESPELRAALDAVLDRLEMFTLAQEQLDAKQQAWFKVALHEELQSVGSQATFAGVSVSVGGVQNVSGGQINIAGGDIIVQGEPSSDPAALRQAYLNRVLESAGRLSLTGIDPKAASEAESRLSLGAVYTALLTLTPEAHEKLERGEMLEQREVRRLSALEQLDQHPRLVLLGDPGSGKSTFVNFVALCLAGESLGCEDANLKLLTAPLPQDDERQREKKEPQPQPWSRGALLPLRVVLRDFAAQGLPAAGEKATARCLWDFIVAELREAALGEFEKPLAQELLHQGGLLLLDGLDEVPEAEQRRVQLKQCIEDFVRTHPKCRVLVTSRTYAYQKQDWRLDGFAEAVLAPFSQGQIRQFVERWYMHIAVLRHMNRVDAQGRAEQLKRAISNNERLSGLAERPLLLTLMASLHAWRGGSLPERREELYADTVDLLLDWWESPKVVRSAGGKEAVRHPSLVEWLKVDRQKVRNLLNKLAFESHAAQPDVRGTADVPEAELVGGLMRLNQNPDVNPARLVEYLSLRAGLLLPRGVGVYTFPHRTFQEYLAACYLTDHDYPEKAAELACADPQRWREVALLAGAKAGRGSASSTWALVDALCYREISEVCQTSEISGMWGALLAGQALVESANLEAISPRNQPKLERVRKWLVHILKSGTLPAVERARAGDELADLGDLRFAARRWYLPDEAMLGFVEIPAGPFRMGSDPKVDRQAGSAEQPQHELTLPVFYLARYPTTNAQYNAFVQAGGYQAAAYWPEAQQAGYWKDGQFEGRYDSQPRQAAYDYGTPFSLPNYPAVGVSWYEALAYCRWLEDMLKKLGNQAIRQPGNQEIGAGEAEFWRGLAEGWLVVTLPSEAEWEKAASWEPNPPFPFPAREGGERGSGRKRVYPWGEEFDPNRANAADTGLGTSSTVGCFPGGASPYGLLDLSGNVWEWTRSLWGKGGSPDFEYPYNPADGREDLQAGSGIARVLRGGAFGSPSANVRCAYRLKNFPVDRYGDGGFRVLVALRPISGS